MSEPIQVDLYPGVFAVREPDDDGLVPPLKVLRKRVNGVYRADGFAGPTRRYVLIVAMLVGLASLPTLAAITAGSNELNDGRTGAMDVPFLPPPSALPSAAAPTAEPSVAEPPSRKPPADEPAPAVRREVVPGPAGRPSGEARPSAADSDAVRGESDEAGYGPAKSPPDSASRPPSRRNPPGGPDTPGGASGSPGRDEPDRDEPDPDEPDRDDPGRDEPGRDEPGPEEPAGRSNEPPPPRKPVRPADRSGFSRPEPCDDRRDRERTDTAHHRSPDRSASTRRSPMTERPHNVRTAGSTERTHNSRRHHAGPRHDTDGAARSYRGSHRAERQHRAGDSGAHHRSSRVGHHHAEHRPRW
jgi:hypothetical protein